MLGSLAFLGLLLGGQPAFPVDHIRYPPAPFASTTLSLDAETGSVMVLAERNVIVEIKPAQYQDMRISRAFYIVCRLAPNDGLHRIGAWTGNPYHLIPVDIVEYKTFDPSYVELDVDTSFFENRDDDLSLVDHRIHIDFFAGP